MLFRNGFLNMQTVNNESDEIKSKENYCNLWVLNNGDGASAAAAAKSRSNINLNTNKSSSTNLSIADAMSKSPSINFDRSGAHDTADKSEEQMQREYLVNLLMQLQKEQNFNEDDGVERKKVS